MKPFISDVASSVPFDNTGIPFDGTDVQTAITELRQNVIHDPEYITTTLNGTTTLVDGNRAAQIISGTATGYTIKMPDATTLNNGEVFELVNQGSQPIVIKDGAGNILGSLSQTSYGHLRLTAQGSAAGTWIYWQIYFGANGVVSFNVISSTNFASSANADTLITGMTVTPTAGTYAIWYSAQNTGSGSGSSLVCTVYRAGVALADSIRKAASPAGTHEFFAGTQTIASFDGTQSCDIRINPQGSATTVNQRSMLLIRLGP